VYKGLDARHKAGDDNAAMARKSHDKSDNGPARIAKVIARAGLASRREAEEWIKTGRVAVNGAVITSPALNVRPADHITVDGRPLPQRERTRLFFYHKPRGLVTTRSDPQGRPTVFDALPKQLPRLISVGRLDINSEGLLLLTNDGGLARVLELPETGWLRRYRVRAHGRVAQAQLADLRNGITVAGVRYGPIDATLDREQGSNVWLTMAIREGKNREIRNVLEHLGLQVSRLIRVSYGPFQLGELAEGEVEEVPTRVLREQLGERVAAQAGADFSAGISATIPPAKASAGERRKPEGREKRPRLRSEATPSLPRRASEEKRGPSPGDTKRDTRDERRPKPRPWRGRGRTAPIRERKVEEAPREKRAGLVTDRKGRRVFVERVRSEPREEAPREATRHEYRGKRRAQSEPREKPRREDRGKHPGKPHTRWEKREEPRHKHRGKPRMRSEQREERWRDGRRKGPGKARSGDRSRSGPPRPTSR
jgi:23S rRNA pseudouridine2605 synthase